MSNIFRSIVFCSLIVPNVAFAQWYDFDPIILRKNVEDGWGLVSRVRINDLGQAVYMTRKVFSPGNRIFIDDVAVYESFNFRPMIGDINDAGQFSFTELNAVYVASVVEGVSRVVDCCEFTTRYRSATTPVLTVPRIDGLGRPYFMASIEGQLEPTPESYVGEADIYVAGEGYDPTLVFHSVFLQEGGNEVELANVGWDVNELGELVIGGVFVGTDETLELERSIGLPQGSQTSLNNHAEFTRHWVIEDERGRKQPAIAVFGERFTVVPTNGKEPSTAIINDHRVIALESSHELLWEIDLLDAETGDITEVMSVDDIDDDLTYFRLHDFNDAGQLAIETSAGLFLVTPQDTPSADLNFDGEIDPGDVDKLAAAIRNESSRSLFDLNQDGLVSAADSEFWITVVRSLSIVDKLPQSDLLHSILKAVAYSGR